MPLSPSELSTLAANLDLMRGETRSQIANPPDHIVSLIGGGPGAAGVVVTPASALTVSAVFAAVRNIAEDVAKLPLKVYRKTGAGRVEADDHPLYPVLHDQPNPEMTAIDARTAVVACAILYGGGYAEPVRNGFGDVVQWWPIEPWRVQMTRDGDRRLVYLVDGRHRFLAKDLFHIRSFNLNGIMGFMLPKVGEDSIGLAIAAQRFAGGFFARGGVPSGVISHPRVVSPEVRDRLRTQWEEMHGGRNNGNKPAFLQEGMTYTPIGIEPQKAQMIESRSFDVEDVARWFRIPPHKIGHLARSTFSNIEHQSIEYVVDTLMPWCVRFEQEAKAKLLGPADAAVFVKHNMDALLRGDTLSRQQAREIQARNGVLNIDEWRASEDMNPLPNGLGTKHYVQLNMTPVDLQQNQIKELTQEPASHTEEMAAENVDRSQRIVMRLLSESLSRCVRREVEVLRRAAKKPEGFEAFATQFFNEHAAYIRTQIATVMELAGVPAAEVDVRIAGYCERSIKAITAGEADAVLDDWAQSKAETETRVIYEPD